MKLSECRRFDQTFTHIDDDGDGMVTVFNTSAMVESAIRGKIEPEEVEIDPALAEFVMRSHAVSAAKADALPEKALLNPILLIQFADGKYLLADGNHRFVKASRVGRKTILAWLLPESVWRDFVVEDIPRNLLEVMIADVRSGA